MSGFFSPRGCRFAVLALLVALACGCAWCADPTPVTITLKHEYNGYYGTTDTYLNQASPYYNYGDYIHFYVRRDDAVNDRTGLIRFDLTGQLPSGACVKSAKLRLYQCEQWNLNWINVSVYRLLKDWTEGTGGSNNGASWYYRHAGGTSPWSNYGARGSGTDRNSVPEDTQTCTPGDRWVEWDVTPSVHYWVANPAKNYGWVLDWTSSNDTEDGIGFRSAQHGTEADHPELVITYVIPTAPLAVTMDTRNMTLNYTRTDPGISWSAVGYAQLLCSGTTTDSVWDGNSSRLNGGYQGSWECSIKVMLENGFVGQRNGNLAFQMWQSSNKYIQIRGIGYGQYYEISGKTAGVGNGVRHDGSTFWSSYEDIGYPSGPPAPGVIFFSETPENEATQFLTWKIRYDDTNKMLYAYVNNALVTYYTGVDFTGGFWYSIDHTNNLPNVVTSGKVQLYNDSTPPTPNPMTWATAPYATSTTAIQMVATTATDAISPPVQYWFERTGSNSGWVSSPSYGETGLSPNTRYGYTVQARDSYWPPNVTAASSTGNVYTLMPTPQGCTASNVTATTVDLSLIGTLPNLTSGSSGILFYSPTPGGNGGINEWIQTTTDQATGLTPNTVYTFQVKARNGDAIETAWGATAATVRTRAAAPGALPYSPIGCQGIRANWSANGNPLGTEYYCEEMTTGQSSGWITGTTWLLTGLTPDTNYGFRVRARNADGVPTPWTDLGPVRTNLSIGQMKRACAPGQPIALSNKLVTAVFRAERLLFISDWPVFGVPDGFGGVAVRYPEGMTPVAEGDIVDVNGTLSLNESPYDQELIILPTMIVRRPPLPFVLVPPSAPNRALGGGRLGCQAGVYDDVTSDPPKPSYGLNFVGSLVRAFGAVSDDGHGGVEYLWIDDGSALNEGNEFEVKGIRVDLRSFGGWPPLPLPLYMRVDGIMRCIMVHAPNGERLNVRVLWPRRFGDLTKVPLYE